MTAKSAREDWKKYWAELATSMEQASNVGDIRKLYQLIRRVSADTLEPWLHEVIGQVWRDEAVPDGWGSNILVAVNRKGDKARCENYHSISLIDFAAVLLRRF
ncbi:unnamed protein product [Dibothriocephalus latus]|uniref:Uncharacterized protein n=1 Tax=Dibothriocephalus latus TaxID=60516 RepID=A0A3P7KZN7_DIBLA|nr:unnamed protein product [Dibothriocephalus latus]